MKQAFPIRRARGLSLVEMMVGIAIGLFIAAGASMLVATQLSDNRRTLVELQLQQDLRVTADIIGRELRRSGYFGNAYLSVATPGSNNAARNGLAGALRYTTGDASQVTFYYWRDDTTIGPFGFRLSNSGAIQSQLAKGGWQDLSDSTVMTITRFSISPRSGPAQKLSCPKLCDLTGQPLGTAADYCWPSISVLELDISITGQAANDANVARTVNSTVRLRNDYVKYNNGSDTQACPS